MSTPSPTPESVTSPLGTSAGASVASGASALLLAAGGLLVTGTFLLAGAALRVLRPETFSWGAAQVDHRNVLLSAAVLVVAALDATAAALLARRKEWRVARGLFLVVFLLGAIFLVLRYQQSMVLFQRGLAWGEGFKPVVAETTRQAATGPEPAAPGEPAADPDATTVPPPAPAPSGLAQIAPKAPAPSHPGLYFGLFHLLSLLTSLLVLAAMTGALRSAFSRGGAGEETGRTAGAFLWRLAAVCWLFSAALLLPATPTSSGLALTAVALVSAVLLPAPMVEVPGRSLGMLALGASALILLCLAGFLTMDGATSRPAVVRYQRPPLIESAEEEEVPVQPAGVEAAPAAAPTAGTTQGTDQGAPPLVETPLATPASS